MKIHKKPPRKLPALAGIGIGRGAFVLQAFRVRVSQEILTGEAGEFLGLARNDSLPSTLNRQVDSGNAHLANVIRWFRVYSTVR